MFFVNVKNVNFKKLTTGLIKERGRRKNKSLPFLYHQFACFDIEATNIDDIKQSAMYIWQFYFNGYVIIGRTWQQFTWFIDKLLSYTKYKIVVYCHNLSYEFSYIRELFQWDDVFIMRSHTILKAETKLLEFRCSYLLTNMSLKKFTEKMCVTQKLSGDYYNYMKQRYFNTKLTKYEMLYCINDVIGLHEGLTKFLNNENKNLYNVPLTSTGFVRKELKNNVRRILKSYYSKERALNLEQYILANNAFRGGNTHANRFYTGKIIKNVFSFDIKSSYPFQLCCKKYPVTPFSPIADYTQEEIQHLLKRGKTAMLLRIEFKNMKLKDKCNPCPYIPLSTLEKPRGFTIDNGRILKCESGIMNLTDIDLRIIQEQYAFDIIGIKACCSKYGYIPVPYVQTILKYFEQKENEKDEYFYMRAKQKLNSIYGVLVTAILRDNIKYKDGKFIPEPVNKEQEIEDNKNKNVLLYQFGVWCSARAREQLQDVINLCGDDFIYCDTDSVKFKNKRHIMEILEYNKNIRKLAEERNIIINNKVMGIWEFEGRYKQLVTLGAKKYCYKDYKDKLHLTVSGVKKKGVDELQGDIKNFRIGFEFKNGGSEGRYNDKYGTYKVNDYLTIEIIENLYIKNHSYKLGVSKDYSFLLDCIKSGEYDLLW